MSINQSVKEELETRIAHEVADKAIPSISYALVGRDGPIARGHIQRVDLQHKLTDKTRFRIASQTKMFTSICLMQLVEQGKVDLDVPVDTYLPGFAPENPFRGNNAGTRGADVTLRKLLSHTAGLIREPKSGHYLDDSAPPLSQTVEEAGRSTLKIDPSIGEFSYSNAGIGVVGRVVEAISGKSYAQYLTDHVFGPLGMQDSAIQANPEILANLAPAYMWTLEGDTPAPVFDLGGAPAGNIYATLPDMERYMTALLRGGFAADGDSVVARSSLNQMWQVIGKRPEGYAGIKGYGLGFGVGDFDGWQSVGHGGALYGFASQISMLPEAGLGIVAISTLDCTNNVVSRLTEAGLRIGLAARKMGKPPAPRLQFQPVTADQLATLPGRYRNDETGEFAEVVTKDDTLVLMGDGMPLHIKPIAGNDFHIDGRLYGEGADYAHLTLGFPAEDTMNWKGQNWSRIEGADTSEPSAEVAGILGEYGPDINVTTLAFANGQMTCLIEYFYLHFCEPLGEGRFKMHGALYPEETLETNVTDDDGRVGIRVGPMFLARRG